MHSQPRLFLSLQLLPILQMETATLLPPEAPKTRLKTAALSFFDFICGSVAKPHCLSASFLLFMLSEYYIFTFSLSVNKISIEYA